jgi:hypothetical protein
MLARFAPKEERQNIFLEALTLVTTKRFTVTDCLEELLPQKGELPPQDVFSFWKATLEELTAKPRPNTSTVSKGLSEIPMRTNFLFSFFALAAKRSSQRNQDATITSVPLRSQAM